MLVADEKKCVGSIPDHYRNSYSHGLEHIYAIQTIDVRTIRPMGSSSEPKQKEIKPEQQPVAEEIPLQLELDLGENYRSWITPFFLKEPIQVLDLSLLAEKNLLENNISDIDTLLNVDAGDLIRIKGMGQGHLDEIRQALDNYIRGRDKKYAYQMDFLSWLLTIIGKEEKKKAKVTLEPYGLEKYIEISHSEEIEVKRLTLEARRDWIEEVIESITSGSIKDEINRNFQNAVNCFVIPWMQKREGIARESEIDERFEKVAVHENAALPVMTFMRSIYYQNQTPYSHHLIPVEEGIYCVNACVAERYRYVKERLRSYFYKPSVVYPLEELVMYVLREFSKKWIDESQTFIEKVIRFSPVFRTRKNERGIIVVRLA